MYSTFKFFLFFIFIKKIYKFIKNKDGKQQHPTLTNKQNVNKEQLSNYL